MGMKPIAHPINPSQFGVRGDGTTDDTTALQALADMAESKGWTLYIPAHMTCKITATLDLRYIRCVQIEGVIKVAHTSGVGVLIGDSSANTNARRILLNEVNYAGSQSNVAVRVVGLKNGHVTINRCPYVQLYADASDSTMANLAYSDFYFGKVDKHEIYGETGVSWINENRFHGGRIQTIIVDRASGGYAHNHNKWYNPNLESATVTINTGSANLIDGARFEGTAPVITFAAGTFKNRIIQTWYSNNAVVSASSGSVTDSGVDNAVITELEREATWLTLFRMDAASRTTDLASEWNPSHATRRVRPGFRKLTTPNANTRYFDSGIFPIETIYPTGPNVDGDRIAYFRFLADAAIWRPGVYLYDATMTLIDDSAGGHMATTGSWVWFTDHYSFSSDQRGQKVVAILGADVKFLRLTLDGGSTAANAPFTYVEFDALVQMPSGSGLVDRIQRQTRRPLYQTGTTPPTQSLLQKGDSIGTDTGRLLVTQRVDTTLTVAAVATNTTITVASATGINTGDNIAVLLDDDTTHFTTVNGAPAGNVITLTAAMPSAAAIGKDVATQRFLHIT